MGEPVRIPPTHPMMFKGPLVRAMLREIAEPGTRWLDNPWVIRIGFRPELANVDAVLRRLAEGGAA